MTAQSDAEDAILGTLKAAWDANTPAITTTAPQLVYEFLEPDLKPHPADSTQPWARVVIRHTDAGKMTLANSDGVARYRRIGLVWVQIYMPAGFGSAWTTAGSLAVVARNAYEGKRALGGRVVFGKVPIIDVAKDGAWVRKDVKASFYWDEVK